MVRNEITVNGNNMQITAGFPKKMILHTVFVDNTSIYEKICQEAQISVPEETSGGRRRKAWRETQEQVENPGELGSIKDERFE